MTMKATGACSQQSEHLLVGQLRSIEAEFRRLYEQMSDIGIQLLFATLSRMLIAAASPEEVDVWRARRVRFQTEAYDTGVEFSAAAICYGGEDDEVGALDEILLAEDYSEIETLIGQLNALYSPFDGGESLELDLVQRRYALTID